MKYQENQDTEGFTRIPNKKRSSKKTMGPEIDKKSKLKIGLKSYKK